LLDDVREFVREEALAFGRSGLELPGTEDDVVRCGEGARLEGMGGLFRGVAGVNADVLKAAAEPRLHVGARIAIKFAAAAELREEASRAIPAACVVVWRSVRRATEGFALQPARAKEGDKRGIADSVEGATERGCDGRVMFRRSSGGLPLGALVPMRTLLVGLCC
jgi:hypothetical protein